MRPAATRLVPLLLALAVLGGCTALANVRSASRPLDTYELTELPAASQSARGTRHLVVEPPTTSGSLATDRIAIRPSPLEIAYLPGARWAEAAPDQLQLLLVRSLTGTGRYALVSRGGARPDPDWFLSTDLQAFEVQLGPNDAVRVAVRLRATIVSDADRRIRGARTFERSVPAAGTDAAAVVPAFESATIAVLRDVTDWTLATAR